MGLRESQTVASRGARYQSFQCQTGLLGPYEVCRGSSCESRGASKKTRGIVSIRLVEGKYSIDN